MPKSRELWLQRCISLTGLWNCHAKHVVFIAGNHDFWFERNGSLEPDMYNMFHKPTDGKLVYLHNKSWEYEHEIESGVPLRSIKSSELPTVSNLVIGRS